MPPIQQIGKAEMQEIVQDYENGGREDSGYCIIDVRNPNEIQNTGKISENTNSLPLPFLAENNVFEMDEDDFEAVCGFTKPGFDETLVFSCGAGKYKDPVGLTCSSKYSHQVSSRFSKGVRSQNAAYLASLSGYTKLVNYMGGSNEWFS